MQGQWRDSRRADKERATSASKSAFKYIGQRLEITSQPIKIHFLMNETGYVDMFSDEEVTYPWLKGMRYWLPTPKRYVEIDPSQDLIRAYANPASYNLNIAPVAAMQKFRPKGYNALAGNVEEWFHLVDMKSDTDPTKTWKERVLCVGRGCEYCAKSIPKVFGKRFHMPFNMHQWRTIVEPLMEKLEHRCKCGGYLYQAYYYCEKCGEVLVPMVGTCINNCADASFSIDEENDTATCQTCGDVLQLLESNSEVLQRDVGSKVSCPKCGHEGYPMPEFMCTTPDCKKDPYGIFDIQITLKKVKGTNDKQYDLQVLNWAIKDHDPRLFDVKNQTTPGGDFEIAGRVAESFKKPIPLEEAYAPTPPSVVSQLVNLPNLFATAAPAVKSKEAYEDTPDANDPQAAGTLPVAGTRPKFTVRK